MGTLRTGCQVKVVNPDTGAICEPNEVGEICIKSRSMMMEFLDRPGNDYFDTSGFGKTGDLGYYRQDGRFFFVDRIKEVVKYCNNIISPTEIEDLIQSHPNVLECLAFGIKNPSVQEELSAVVVLKDEGQVRVLV